MAEILPYIMPADMQANLLDDFDNYYAGRNLGYAKPNSYVRATEWFLWNTVGGVYVPNESVDNSPLAFNLYLHNVSQRTPQPDLDIHIDARINPQGKSIDGDRYRFGCVVSDCIDAGIILLDSAANDYDEKPITDYVYRDEMGKVVVRPEYKDTFPQFEVVQNGQISRHNNTTDWHSASPVKGRRIRFALEKRIYVPQIEAVIISQ